MKNRQWLQAPLQSPERQKKTREYTLGLSICSMAGRAPTTVDAGLYYGQAATASRGPFWPMTVLDPPIPQKQVWLYIPPPWTLAD